VEHARAPSLDAPPLLRYGFPALIRGVSPAAGADYISEIDGRYFWRIVSVFCRLVASSDVAEREVVLEYRDQENNRYALAGAPVTVAASTTIDYAFNAFTPEAVWPVDSSIVVPLPPMILNPTDDFRLHIVNAQAADQLSRIRYRVEQFFSDSPIPG
jgi:hypothetical protein